MEKRVVFRSAWLPYALVAPQIVITVLFFCALSISGALFLILDMAQPFTGFVRIASAPLQNALGMLGQ